MLRSEPVIAPHKVDVLIVIRFPLVHAIYVLEVFVDRGKDCLVNVSSILVLGGAHLGDEALLLALLGLFEEASAGEETDLSTCTCTLDGVVEYCAEKYTSMTFEKLETCKNSAARRT